MPLALVEMKAPPDPAVPRDRKELLVPQALLELGLSAQQELPALGRQVLKVLRGPPVRLALQELLAPPERDRQGQRAPLALKVPLVLVMAPQARLGQPAPRAMLDLTEPPGLLGQAAVQQVRRAPQG